MITKSIGKNTLGGGNKMNVNMRTYNRSTHNLSHVWRNTQSVGTLVPFLVEPALPGDTHEIKLNANVMTHPTVGPLFGSFKLQLDVFSCPIRLYQAKLHNNALGIGLDMSKVELPYITMQSPLKNIEYRSSALQAYLGIRGVRNTIETKINAIPYLAYWDIYKNYYCNKQEKNGAYISSEIEIVNAKLTDKNGSITYVNVYENRSILIGGGRKLELETPTNITFTLNNSTNDKQFTKTFSVTLFNGLDMTDLKTVPITEIFSESGGVWSFNNSNWAGWEIWSIQATENTNFIGIRQFPIGNIDTMREELLKGTVAITTKGKELNLYPYLTSGYRNGITDAENKSATGTNQFQLALKTYQSDIFNNWIQTEWIDGDNGINAITAIDTTGGEFTLDTLNMAKKVYDMLNRIALSGGTYQDWIETVYTNNYIERSETPIYEGGMSQEIVFQEVISQSAAENEPLGSLAGRGTLAEGSRKGGTIKIKTSEPSFIIGIVSITPRVDYSQGNAYWNDWKTMNDLHKPALDGIGFQDLLESKMAWWGTGAVGKQPAWLDYMTAVNRVYGNFAAGYSESFMILDRNYTPSDDGKHIKDLTTYIDPSKWNGIFADQSIDAMNFWVQIGIGMQARRVMSAKMIPNL